MFGDKTASSSSQTRCDAQVKRDDQGAKSFPEQARTAERAAYQSPDVVVSGQMKTLAAAFRAQADILKKKRKKKK